MKHRITILLFLLISLNVQAQLAPEQAEQLVEGLRSTVEYLSSEECLGRETADAGMERAKEYIINQMEEIGILPAFERDLIGNFRQTVPFIQKEIYGGELLLAGESLEFGQDFYFFRNMPYRAFTADALEFVGYGLDSKKYSDYNDKDFTGKAVIILGDDVPKKQAKIYSKNERKRAVSLNKRLADLRAKNPSFIVVARSDFKKSFEKYRHYIETPGLELDPNYMFDEQEIAVRENNFIGTVYADREKINPILKNSLGVDAASIGKKKVKSGTYKTVNKPARFAPGIAEAPAICHNVAGYIPGANEERVIVLSAHLDHLGIDHEEGEIYYGADDNGSGSAALLEIARMLMEEIKNGNPIPPNPVMFLWFTGEEKGLLGSKFYSRYPAFPIEHTLVNLNVDMIGRSDKYHGSSDEYIYLIGADRNSDALTGIIEMAAEGIGVELDFKFNHPEDPNRFYYRSDHINFAKNDVPVAFFFSGVHEDYHKSTDTADKLNFDVMSKRTQLIYHSTVLLSDYEEPLQSEAIKEKILKAEALQKAERIKEAELERTKQDRKRHDIKR